MDRIICLVGIFLQSAIETYGQCANAPSIALSSTSGSTCVTSPVTVSVTFGGSANRVTISENGNGSVSPEKSSTSPFKFTYTPQKADLGKQVSITITTNDPPGKSCTAAKITYRLTVNESPPVPERGRITQPTCLVPTGSVVLNGLPGSTWTISRSPGGSEISGTGSTSTVSGLGAGKYNFTVANSAGCISSSSGDVIINSPPSAQTMKITDPAPVYFPSTADLTASSVTSGSGSGLTYTYWRNSDATVSYSSPSAATEGTYYIKGTSASNGCFDIKPVTVRVEHKPVDPAGPDQNDPLLPSLITPNMDGRNDYFKITLSESMGKTELVIFDRSGIRVYDNMNYDNRWNGVDYNGDPLPDGTYFYFVKPGFGKSLRGFIVIKR